MIRARWFGAQWQNTLRALAARMRTRAFTDTATEGFLIERTRENYIEGRYIEKLTYEESIADSLGKETAFERTTYRQVPFTFHQTF